MLCLQLTQTFVVRWISSSEMMSFDTEPELLLNWGDLSLVDGDLIFDLGDLITCCVIVGSKSSMENDSDWREPVILFCCFRVKKVSVD